MSILDREKEAHLCGVDQTNFQFLKNCRSRESQNMKKINFLSRKSKHMDAGSNKQKSLDNVEICQFFYQETRKISELGRTKSKNSFVGSRKSKVTKIG